MYKAIQVKCLPATNTKPTRYKAFADCGKTVVKECGQFITNEGCAHAAAKELAGCMGWRGQWIGGGLPSGDYVFVNRSCDYEFEIKDCWPDFIKGRKSGD